MMAEDISLKGMFEPDFARHQLHGILAANFLARHFLFLSIFVFCQMRFLRNLFEIFN